MITRRCHLCLIIAVLLSLWTSLPACSSGVRTPIYESPEHNVYLEWVPDDSFRASHPATISQTVLHRTLTGILVQKQKGFLDMVTGNEREAKRVFSDADVEFMAPYIASALSQATPEEHIVFQRLYAYELGSNQTAGTLYLKDDLIFVTITHYARNPGRPDLRYVDNRQVGDTKTTGGLADSKTLFVPEEAFDSSQSRQETQKPILAINYRTLESLPAPVEEAAVAPRPRQRESSSTPRQTGDPSEPSSEDASLRALEEQMNKQEEELKQLKEELRELQREGQE